MRNSYEEEFAETMRSSQFSSDMVTSFFVHVAIILIDRFIDIWR